MNTCDVSAGALHSLDELSEERSNLEKAFRWEWDNDDVLKGRMAPGVNPNQAFREGLKRYAHMFNHLTFHCHVSAENLPTRNSEYVAFERCLGLTSHVLQNQAWQVQ